MKTLPEILRDVIAINEEAHAPARNGRVIVIARGDHEPLDGRSSAFQLQVRHDVDMGLDEYRCVARSWLGEEWSIWREHRGWLGGGGFDVSDVLATDWRIIA